MVEEPKKEKLGNPRSNDWAGSAFALKGWMGRIGGSLDVPFKSISIFVGSWMMLEIGWPLLTVLGVATAGSVWSIPTAIPCMFVVVYAMILASGANLVRSLVTQMYDRRDNLVKALFRGYFWSLLSIGIIYLVHTYFHAHLPLLFVIPILYFVPIAGLPVPIPLGTTGWYMNILAMVVVYTVGVTGSCIGGIEILGHLLENSRQHGAYGAVFGVLLLTVFPALNIYFSLVFLESTIDIFWGLIPFGT